MANSARLFRDEIRAMPEKEKNQIYKNLFMTETGKVILEDLRQRCFSYISTVNSINSVHPNETIFKEGMRSVVLHIENQLQLTADDFKPNMEGVDEHVE